MDDQGEFENASNKFLNWFNSHPSTTFHRSLKIADLRECGSGRGIIATEDIPAETDLFTIPRSIIISEENSDLAKKLPNLFKHEPSQGVASGDETTTDDAVAELPSSWLNLILILLYESFHHRNSPWSAYLSVLPQRPSSFDTLMFWNSSEIAQLQTSAMASKIGKSSADRMFREHVLPTIKEHGDIFYGSSTPFNDEELLLRCHVMGSLIMSYAFDLQPDDEDDDDDESPDEEENNDGWIEDRSKPSIMGMVPMADMLNADAQFNAHLSHGEDALTMTSLRTIRAGEEVLNYYGPLPTGELLRRYGYTSQKHSRYDVVEISWDLVKEVLREVAQWKQFPAERAAEQVESTIAQIESDEYYAEMLEGFILEREAGDPNEQGLCLIEAKFSKFSDELVSIISDIAEKLTRNEVKKRKLGSEAESKLVKSTSIDILAHVVAKRLTAYATSVSEDEALLKHKDTNGRLKMAIDVRLGEKRLLQEALDWTGLMQKKYQNVSSRQTSGDQSARQHPKKKQKTGR